MAFIHYTATRWGICVSGEFDWLCEEILIVNLLLVSTSSIQVKKPQIFTGAFEYG
jgi:hypothetical protein